MMMSDTKPIGLEDAIALAVTAHDGQKDKAGEPYILHPLRVMLAMPRDETLRMIAVLHGVIEDTHWTLADLRQIGYPDRVLEALSVITRNEYEPYLDYIKRCALNPQARRVKMADLRDNLSKDRVHVVTYNCQTKYQLALAILEEAD